MWNSKLNGHYHFKKMVNQRQMYETTNGEFGIWNDGHSTDPEWMIGTTTSVDAGEFTTGFAQSNEDAQCPEFGNASTVWWKGQWSSNNNLAVTCIGKI